jgi:uncharacterized protein YbjT (DUF2867 family)
MNTSGDDAQEEAGTMRVAVVGGTGSVGASIVRELVARGDEVRVLSRRPPADAPLGTSHHRVDVATGEGLEEAIEGVDAVVDAANDSRRADDVLVAGTRRLTAAEAHAGVAHHVAISIVGCERVPAGYYRAKVAQEQAVAAAAIPWSLLRATQFHTLLAGAFAFAERRRFAPTGKARFQAIAPAVVAKRIADAVHEGPGGRLPDIAGPEVQTLSELAAAWRRQSDRRVLPVRLPMIGRLGKPLREGALCNPVAATDGPTFEEWLRSER